MLKVGETPSLFRSYNTCQYRGRSFHFSLSKWGLVVTEVIFGKRVEFVAVETHVKCIGSRSGFIACCPLNSGILVVAEGRENPSAVLVAFGQGKLTSKNVYVLPLTVEGDQFSGNTPFLSWILGDRALLYFTGKSDMWYCDVVNDVLKVSRLKTHMPAYYGFSASAARLPNGSLVVAGSHPWSKDITLISCAKEPQLRRLGDIPGDPRELTTITLVRGRFLVGFGGHGSSSLNDLWVFDLQTGKGSAVGRRGDWHSKDSAVFLASHADNLYILGGGWTKAVSRLPLAALSDLIRNEDVKSAFKASLLSPEAAVVELPRIIRESPAEVEDFSSELSLTSSLGSFEDSLQENPGTAVHSGEYLRKGPRSSLVLSLQADLRAAREEIASLKVVIESLQEELERVTPLPGSYLICLPVSGLPAVSFPRRWRVDSRRLKDFRTSMRTHKTSLPQQGAFLQEYKDAFSPFLDREFTHQVFSLRASVPAARTSENAISQVSSSIFPGQAVSPDCRLSALAKLSPLRPAAKFLESDVCKKVASRSYLSCLVAQVRERAPPSYHLAVSLLDSIDCLEAEHTHQSTGRVRRVIQGAQMVSSIEKVDNLVDLIRSLKKVWKLETAKWGAYVEDRIAPWLDPDEKPQSQSPLGENRARKRRREV